MPALPAVNHVVRMDFHQTLAEDVSMITRLFFHWTGSGLSTSDADNMASAGSSAWRIHLEPTFGTFHALDEVIVTDLTSAMGAVGLDTTTNSGADTGDPLAADTAMRFKFLQPRRYRGGHPGVYLGGFVEDRLVDAQTWSAATLAELGTAFNNMEAAIIGAGGGGGVIDQWVLVSYYEGFTVVISPTTGRARNKPTLRGAPLVTNISGFEIDSKVSSQRRRSLIRQ